MSAQAIGESHFAPVSNLAALERPEDLLARGMFLVRRAAIGAPEGWAVVLVHPDAPQASQIHHDGRLFARALSIDALQELATEMGARLDRPAAAGPARPVLVIAKKMWGVRWVPLADLSAGRGDA